MTGRTLTERAHGDAAPEERRPDPEQMLRAHIQRMEPEFQLAMPKGVEAAQLVRDALTLLRQSPGVAKCEAQSVLGSLMTCAQLGLRVGVLGEAWVLPFWDRKSSGFKAQLVVGYQGLAKLGYRSDLVAGITARTVFENDPVFDVDFGSEDRLVHKPLLSGDRGEPIAYYCVVHIKGGRPIFYVMSHADMEAYRDRHAMARTREGRIVGPWVEHFEGMAHKTCLRQLSKWMPKSTELAAALVVDDGVRVDLTPTSAPEEATHHYPVVAGEVAAGEQDGSPPPDDEGDPDRTRDLDGEPS